MQKEEMKRLIKEVLQEIDNFKRYIEGCIKNFEISLEKITSESGKLSEKEWESYHHLRKQIEEDYNRFINNLIKLKERLGKVDGGLKRFPEEREKIRSRAETITELEKKIEKLMINRAVEYAMNRNEIQKRSEEYAKKIEAFLRSTKNLVHPAGGGCFYWINKALDEIEARLNGESLKENCS
jgi:DNA repair exonuclease SbcCD ATPase subunit